jgi:adenylate kinase
VHVQVSSLVKAEIAKKDVRGKMLLDVIKNGDNVPDDILIELVKDRITKIDCLINGWVLDGFPISQP